MKNKTKKRLILTSITEYKALEEYFEKMAAKGWMMKEFKKGMMVFEESESKELKFNVSIFNIRSPFDYPDYEKDKEYGKTFEDQGWTFCASNQLYHVFYKKKNHQAVPIHTDSTEEYSLIKKIYMKTELISMLALIPMLWLGYYNISNFRYDYILSNGGLYNIIFPFLILIIILNLNVYPLVWLIKNKINVSKGKELSFTRYKGRVKRDIVMWCLIGIYLIIIIYLVFMDIPHFSFILIPFVPLVIGITIGIFCVKRFSRKKYSSRHKVWGFIGSIILSLIITFILLFVGIQVLVSSDFLNKKNETPPDNIKLLHLSDFTEIDSIETDTFLKKSSLFAPISFLYYERTDKKIPKEGIRSVDTHYIQCINKRVADFVFDEYMKEEFERKEEWSKREREWGNEQRAIAYENDIKEVSTENWGVDRGYYLYENKDKIIIQQGNIIYILRGDLDFSDKEIVRICREKLGL